VQILKQSIEGFIFWRGKSSMKFSVSIPPPNQKELCKLPLYSIRHSYDPHFTKRFKNKIVVYILWANANSKSFKGVYCGYTTTFKRRLAQHRNRSNVGFSHFSYIYCENPASGYYLEKILLDTYNFRDSKDSNHEMREIRRLKNNCLDQFPPVEKQKLDSSRGSHKLLYILFPSKK